MTIFNCKYKKIFCNNTLNCIVYTSLVINVKYFDIEFITNCSKGQCVPKYIKMKFPLYLWKINIIYLKYE